jgi:nucleoside-diphosphate-sugar epimerase/MFS family permease
MTTDNPAAVHPARVLFPLGLGTALSLMGDATLYAVLPTHTEAAGISLGAVGTMLGVNRAVRLFSNGPAGALYDRSSRRRLFIAALFLGALSTALYAATRGFWPLLLARMLWGLAWSGIWVGGAAMILDVAGPRTRGRWTGMYQIWFFIGQTLGAFGGGLLTDRLGYHTTMWIGAALTAVGGVVAWFMLPETRHARTPPDGGPASESGGRSHPAPRRPLGLRANGSLWLAVSLQGANRFIISGVLSATLGLVVRDWAQSAGIGLGVATLTGLVIAGQTLLSMGAAPLAGTVSDRMGSRWTVAAWGLALGLAGMALLVGAAAAALCRGSVQSLATILTGDLVPPAQRGRAIGLLHTVGDFGSAVGPTIAYALMPWIGLRAIYLLGAALFLVTLIPTLARAAHPTGQPDNLSLATFSLSRYHPPTVNHLPLEATMRVLVTGGTGTVGREAVRRLIAHDHDVTVIGRTPDLEIVGGTYRQCDIVDFDCLTDSVRDMDGIVHLAAIPNPALGPGQDIFRVNCTGTFNVYRAAADAGIRRIVSASSINALGYNFGIKRFELQYFPMDEAHPSYTTDPYSFSKQVMEEIGAYFWRREGLSSVFLRLPAVYEITEENEDRMRSYRERIHAQHEEILAKPEDERRAVARDIIERHDEFRAQHMFESRDNWRKMREHPYAGVMFSYSNFWAIIDARDSAQAIEKGLLADYQGSHPLWVNDSHNAAGVPTQALAELFYPDVPLTRPLEGTETLVSIDKARALLGYEPEYSMSRYF